MDQEQVSGLSFVALRKESVDRNLAVWAVEHAYQVALRKESVDRNINCNSNFFQKKHVALRKESVDRNSIASASLRVCIMSLSARRAWIEISSLDDILAGVNGRSPQGERG